MSGKRYLVLQNGKVFEGEPLGANGEEISEIVFTTSMTAYLETLTDPSYKGQAVVQTFPLIGNYGIITPDKEGEMPRVSGYIVRTACDRPSNFRCEEQLDNYLKENNIIGLKGIDTRSLTRVLRECGTMNGMICDDPSHADLEKIKAYRITDPVSEVTIKQKKVYEPEGQKRAVVALIDYGVKYNIIRSLQKRGCEVHLFPSFATADEISEIEPDGLFLSNGPGDPEDNKQAIEVLKELRRRNYPTMGICLGHQLLALSHGFRTGKLKYGHRGSNHPVRNEETGKIYISSQNHGYEVLGESIDEAVAKELFVNVNDGTNEGIRYLNENAFSVQFHPEACGGPQDTEFLFDEFMKMMGR
ncbi:MAG: carbamoyl phosphate synthase small subunit [Clostridiales bacterium]|nr:carbamoyl phosphate synthase small subunit [Clostridiales bacterium]